MSSANNSTSAASYDGGGRSSFVFHGDGHAILALCQGTVIPERRDGQGVDAIAERPGGAAEMQDYPRGHAIAELALEPAQVPGIVGGWRG